MGSPTSKNLFPPFSSFKSSFNFSTQNTNFGSILVSGGLIYVTDNIGIQVWNATNGNQVNDISGRIIVRNSVSPTVAVIGYQLYTFFSVLFGVFLKPPYARYNFFDRLDVRSWSWLNWSPALNGQVFSIYAANSTQGDGLIFVGLTDNSSIAVLGVDNITTIRYLDLPLGCNPASITTFDRWVFGGCHGSSNNSNIYQFDYYSGSMINSFSGNSGNVNTLAIYSVNLISGSDDGTIRQWNLTAAYGGSGNFSPILTSKSPDRNAVNSIATTPNGNIAGVTSAGTVFVLDATSGQIIKTILSEQSGTASSVTVDQQGIMYVSYTSGTIAKWNTTSC